MRHTVIAHGEATSRTYAFTLFREKENAERSSSLETLMQHAGRIFCSGPQLTILMSDLLPLELITVGASVGT
jgi:hypothetical protein